MKWFAGIIAVACMVVVCGCGKESPEEQLAFQIKLVGQPVKVDEVGAARVVRVDSVPETNLKRVLVKSDTSLQVFSMFVNGDDQYAPGDRVEIVRVVYQYNGAVWKNIETIRKR